MKTFMFLSFFFLSWRKVSFPKNNRMNLNQNVSQMNVNLNHKWVIVFCILPKEVIPIYQTISEYKNYVKPNTNKFLLAKRVILNEAKCKDRHKLPAMTMSELILRSFMIYAIC